MYFDRILRAFTNTTGRLGVNAAAELECYPLTFPKASCRLWKSHSRKS